VIYEINAKDKVIHTRCVGDVTLDNLNRALSGFRKRCPVCGPLKCPARPQRNDLCPWQCAVLPSNLST